MKCSNSSTSLVATRNKKAVKELQRSLSCAKRVVCHKYLKKRLERLRVILFEFKRYKLFYFYLQAPLAWFIHRFPNWYDDISSLKTTHISISSVPSSRRLYCPTDHFSNSTTLPKHDRGCCQIMLPVMTRRVKTNSRLNKKLWYKHLVLVVDLCYVPNRQEEGAIMWQ